MQKESNKTYIVYPSWVTLSYAWEDLPTLFKNPLSTPYLNKTKEEYEARGWICDNSIEYELIDGNFGGGIIKIEANCSEKVPAFYIILFSEANVTSPHEIHKITQNVRYIEPYQRTALELSIGLTHCKLYTCYIGFRDFNISDNDIFWALRFNPGKKVPIDKMEEILPGIKAFGIEAEFINSTQESKVIELEKYLEDNEVEHQWLRFPNYNNDLYLNIAVMIYIAFYLAKSLGRKFRGSILIV